MADFPVFATGLLALVTIYVFIAFLFSHFIYEYAAEAGKKRNSEFFEKLVFVSAFAIAFIGYVLSKAL